MLRPPNSLRAGRFAAVVLLVALGAGVARAQAPTVSTTAATVHVAAADTARICPGPCMPRRPWIAVGEGVLVNAFVLLANKIGRPDDEGFHIGLNSWQKNLQLGWNWDDNQFKTNLRAHPYHGGLYFNAGRSNGLNFWESTPLTFLGSAEWEYFGETHRPALNDFFMTSFGGIAIGEMTHRAASLVRDNGAHGSNRMWDEIFGTLIDPVGGFNRFVFGQMNDIGPNPQEHFPSALGLTAQTGARFMSDSTGSLSNTSSAVNVLFDVAYGDAFEPYKSPWDAFHLRGQFSLGESEAGGGLTLLRGVGRLYGSELTAADANNRQQFVIWQMYDYVSNPAYVYGGQSIGFGFLSRWRAQSSWFLGTNASVQIIPMGAVQTDSVASNGRLYDFGPGAGIVAGASLNHRGVIAPIISAQYRLDYIHAVSGSDADHYVQLMSVEGEAPLKNGVGVGAAWNFYLRDSKFSAPRLPEYRRRPEFRVYLTWNLDHRPPTGGTR
jgi:uncharacterized protein DUF3943